MSDVVLTPDGIPIRFDAIGNGDRALVFVHGWSCDRTYWRHQVDAFVDSYRVVTIDLAGQGESGVGRASWTMPAFGADVVAVIDALGLLDVVLIGHSMGGDVIVEAALTLGDRVGGLVWVDTYRYLTEPSSEEDVDAFVAPFRRDFVGTTRSFVRGMFRPETDRDLVDWIVADMSSAPPDVAVEALNYAVANEGPVMTALPRLAIPIVAINPDDRPTDAASLGKFGIETIIASGVGHFLMLEHAKQFNRLLSEVLIKWPSPGRSLNPRALPEPQSRSG
jgi:pimeloyl-ACP methyl ester carboxylesterase